MEIEGTIRCTSCGWESDDYDQWKDASTHDEFTSHSKFHLDGVLVRA